MSKFSFSSPGSRASVVKSLRQGQQAHVAQEATSLELEFVFLPTDDAFNGGSWASSHPGPWKNPNRQGTPLAFWRKVKDTLRHLIGSDYRGSYIAPGPHGRRNNIERQPLPGRGIDLPGSGKEGIGQLASRRPRLEVPALPPFSLPDLPHQSPVVVQHLPTPHGAPSRPIPFKGQLLEHDKPIRYSQEILFIEDTDRFINRTAARRVLSDLLALMQQHPNVQVRIEGNAANDFRAPALGFPYGHNKKLLMKFPAWGIYEGKAYYGNPFRTMGDLMLARARAIGNLLISQGIAPSRVHCTIGSLGYGTLGVPGSGARKRRATIIISN